MDFNFEPPGPTSASISSKSSRSSNLFAFLPA